MMIGKIISHYEILEKIGEGGMGEIYKAKDLRLNRFVAIKILPPHLNLEESRHLLFINEAQTASALNHPNICSIYDVDNQDGVDFIVMEFIEGESLRDILDRDKLLPIDKVLDITSKICSALKLTHEKGIIHRDIKPDNIMFSSDDNLKIMDFGLAKLKHQSREYMRETSTDWITDKKLELDTSSSSLHGTANYMAPELIKKEAYDDRVDIFSLGVMLYESLTGILPFTGKDYIDVLQSILTTEPEAPSKLNPEITPELDRVILKAMEKNPQNRYTSMEEFCKEIEKVRSKGEIFKRIRKLTLQAFGFTTVIIVLAFAFIQGGQYLISHFNLDSRWNQILLIWVMLGLLISGIVIYYHRKQGPRHIFESEIILYSAILVIGCLSSIWYWKSTNIASSGSILPEPVSSIAVMYFEDNTGDEESKWLSRGLPHMLITSLEQIPELQVIGYQRLYDIIMEINKEDVVSIDKKTATTIAQKAGAKVILMGSIFKWGNRIRIDYQLQDVNNGNLIHADKVYGDDPFVVADNLAAQVRLNLDLPVEREEIWKVSDITTQSKEAYRYYLKGKELESKYLWNKARASYQKAIEIDSTFAMAYKDLRNYWAEAGLTQAENEAILKKAVKYAEQTSERERLLIYASAAEYYGDISGFKKYTKELIDKYPFNPDGYNLMARINYDRREFDLYIQNLKKIALITNSVQPSFGYISWTYRELREYDSANYYGNKVIESYPELVAQNTQFYVYDYLHKGDYELACTEAFKAISIEPDMAWAHRTLGIVYLYMNKFTEAESEFLKTDSLGWFGQDMELIPIARLYQGKYKKALEYIRLRQNSKNTDVVKMSLNREITFHKLQNNLFDVKKIWNINKDFLIGNLSLRTSSDNYIADSLLCLCLRDHYYNGEILSALAVCDLVEKEIKEKDLGGGYFFDLSMWQAGIFFHNKNYLAASQKYQFLVNEEPRIYFLYRLAQCFYYLNDYKKAKAVLLSIDINKEPIPWWIELPFGYAYPRKFYLLGKVNEALGKKDEAIEAYQQFLEIWKEADADLPELIDAKKRIAELKGINYKRN